MAHLFLVALNLLVYVFIVISALMWLQFLWNVCGIQRFGDRGNMDPRIEFVARSPPFWSAADFLVMFGTFVLAGSGVAMIFISQGWLPPPSTTSSGEMPATSVPHVMDVSELYARTYVGILAGLIAMGVALMFILLSRRNKRDAIVALGFNFNKTTLERGLWGSLWLIPPVLLLSLLVSSFVPYQHPVLETLAAIASQSSLFGFLLLFIATAVVTPVVEEFMFRVLLQGGLQGMIDRPGPDDDTISQYEAKSWRARSWWPIVLASVLFAMMHVGQGAAPIPLFVLSLGLGYLYRQTGSIVPPLIVHMVLNGMTTIVEFTRLLAA